MNKYNNRLKRIEKRANEFNYDPIEIIQIVKRILNMSSYKEDEKEKIPLSDDEKVHFWEFVIHFGNSQIQRAKDNGWDIEEQREFILNAENRIKEKNGFLSYDLPKDITIEYK